MTGISASQLVHEVAVQLDRYLAPIGFVLNRKSDRFYLRDQASCVVVELQKSSKSTASAPVIAANAGIWNATLARTIGGPASGQGINAMDCHWWLRAGQIDDIGQGRWWTLGVTDDPQDVAASEIWPSLSAPVALLVPLRDDASFLQYLLSAQGPFLDPMNRWAFALALANATGNRDAQARATDELKRIAESRTLPIQHKMLLQSVD